MNPERGPRGWHSRGYLPHLDAGNERTQSVTFRLADSVPRQTVVRWQEELQHKPEAKRALALYQLVETFLDAGYGACYLRDPQIAELVESALLFFDGERYTMHAWVVMPNHVHALFTPAPAWSLSDIMLSWKSFTGRKANEFLGRSGQFWQEDYFDRYVRSENHYHDVLAYIERNPVKAGL